MQHGSLEHALIGGACDLWTKVMHGFLVKVDIVPPNVMFDVVCTQSFLTLSGNVWPRAIIQHDHSVARNLSHVVVACPGVQHHLGEVGNKWV